MSSIEFKNIIKIFPGVRALDGVSFKVDEGRVVAICGENGAGKSTLLKVLNGDYHPDGGEYLIDGKQQSFRSPQEAIQAGISVIYQERQLVPYLSVAENIFMEDIPQTRFHFIDKKKLIAEARKIIDEFKLPIDPTSKVRDISVAHQQMVEIMKSCRRNPKIIAFDEPTASLSNSEVEILFEVISNLKKKGISVLYVSHRLPEIFEIADEVVVLKDGRFIKQINTSEITEKELICLMVGRDLGDIFSNLKRNEKMGEVILKVNGLSNQYVKDVSFSLRAGEVLGFSGLVGSGRTETMLSIFGALPYTSGEIRIDGKLTHIKKTGDAIKQGVCLCPEDRKDQGIFPIRSVKDNISVVNLRKVSRGQWIRESEEINLAKEYVSLMNVKTTSINQRVGELSGGNQQKVILARWLASDPRILILDEPTKGIDVGTKAEIYQMICNLASNGYGVIVISSELPEVIGVCDRIVVMHNGRVTGEIDARSATESRILEMAML